MKIEMWTNVYIEDVEYIQKHGIVEGPFYPNQEEADEACISGNKRVACIKFTGELNVEEQNTKLSARTPMAGENIKDDVDRLPTGARIPKDC
jgi:hypothetical protein